MCPLAGPAARGEGAGPSRPGWVQGSGGGHPCDLSPCALLAWSRCACGFTIRPQRQPALFPHASPPPLISPGPSRTHRPHFPRGALGHCQLRYPPFPLPPL